MLHGLNVALANNRPKQIATARPEIPGMVSRPFFMTNIQRLKLKDYLSRPIKHFDIVLDDSKNNLVWKHFGELAYKDPETGNIHVIDTSRRYCLQCIRVAQAVDPTTEFERTNMCFFATTSHSFASFANHLILRHKMVMNDD